MLPGVGNKLIYYRHRDYTAGWTVRGSNPGTGFSPKIRDWFGGSLKPSSQWVLRFFPGVKAVEA